MKTKRAFPYFVVIRMEQAECIGNRPPYSLAMRRMLDNAL